MLKKIMRALGYDLVPRGAPDPATANLAALLDSHNVDLIVDVGANEGQYATRARNAGYRGGIVSFEPVSEAHGKLSAAAQGDAKWTVAPRMAIGDRDGEVAINVSNRTDMSSVREIDQRTLEALPKSFMVGQEQVPMRTLDHALGEVGVAGDRPFLKVDTQGYEAQVLDGAPDLLGRVVGVQLELSLIPNYEGEALYLDLLNRLAGLGFEPFMVLPGFFSRTLGRQLQFDVVAMRPES